jgi:hypothetical protein
MKTLIFGLITGILFGFFLQKARVIRYDKQLGALRLMDMTIVKFMLSTILVGMVGVYLLQDLGLVKLSIKPAVLGGNILGGLIFGVGFVMGGWCPGTAFVGLASAKWDALVFLVGAGAGSILFNEIFHAVEPLYTGQMGGYAGLVYLPDVLHMSPKAFTLVLSLFAVLSFAGCTRLEQRQGEMPLLGPVSVRRHKWAAATLMSLVVELFFVRSPTRGTEGLAQGGSGFLHQIAMGEDHVDPIELAERMLAEREEGTAGFYRAVGHESAMREHQHLAAQHWSEVARLESLLAG